jgi:pyruvate formate lyase activating enzyme
MIMNTSDNTVKGNLLRIERSSIHDGQGLRTVIFLKGCTLGCPWCSTPESQHFEAEKGYDNLRCIACFKCMTSCPAEAISVTGDGLGVETDREKCRHCFQCLEVCPVNAVKKYGYIATVAEVLEEISKDEVFYYHSGGGVTLSGGEPLCQPEFCSQLLHECKKIGINTAIETSLQVSFENLASSLPWLDHLYADIKHMDDTAHRLATGESNKQILENILKADQSELNFGITVRVPLIPGFNDGESNLLSVADFCSPLKKIRAIELLPYHRMGIDTYRLLGLDYSCSNVVPPTINKMQELADLMSSRSTGISVGVGSGLTLR